MKLTVRPIPFIIGAVVICVGIGLKSLPIAVITAGVFIILIALTFSLNPKKP